MDSIPLEMDDIFGEEDEVEDFSPSRLPDLEDELEPMRNDRDEAGDAQDDTDNAELLAKLKNMKGASKNVARKSHPKLDATRLTSDRGIPIIPTVFQDIPLKGKNHEKEDLKTIMQRLEHWAHRLFPKMTFSEVLERTERLGTKKEVQSCVKRIRLGMPVRGADGVEDEDDVVRAEPLEDQVPRPDLEEENSQRSEDSGHENEIDDDEVEELLKEQMLPVNSLSWTGDATSQSKVMTPAKPINEIPDSIKARIEQNKKLALERRAAKLKLMQENKGDSPDSSIICDQPQTTISPSSTKGEAPTNVPLTESENMTVDGTLSDTDVSHINNADVSCIPDADVSRIPDADVSRIPDADVSRIPDADVSRIPDADVSRIPDSDVSHINDADVSHINDADVSHIPDADVQTYSEKQQPSCAEAETQLHNDKLLEEDSDSEMLYIADV